MTRTLARLDDAAPVTQAFSGGSIANSLTGAPVPFTVFSSPTLTVTPIIQTI